MAHKSHSLKVAAQVAQSREQTAVKALGESQQRLADHERQLEQLVVFRGEYAAQLRNEGNHGISPRRYRNYLAFLNHMDSGIVQVQQQMVWLEQELARKRVDWVQSRARTKALEEVMERDRKAQLRQEDRREQIDSDERNLHSLARRAHLADSAG